MHVVGLDLAAAARVGVVLLLGDALAGLPFLEVLHCEHINEAAAEHGAATAAAYKQQALPAALGSLPALRELRLPACNVLGSLPPELGNAAALEVVDLGSTAPIDGFDRFVFAPTAVNFLTSTIPPALGALPKLRELVLTGNRLSGTLPHELSEARSLEVLDLAGNVLHGAEVPEALWAMPSLRRVYLSGNGFTGTISPRVAEASALEVVWLNNNAFYGPLPFDELLGLPNIKSLLLSNSGVGLTGTIPATVGNARTLEQLCLTGMWGITGTIPPQLNRLSRLKILCITETGITGTIPNLGNLENANIMLLGANDYDPQPVPAFVAMLPYLGWLHLSKSNLQGTIPLLWGYFWPGMALLHVAENPGIVGELFPTLEERQRNVDETLARYMEEDGDEAEILRNGGYIPTALPVFPALELLDMGGSRLSGSLPKLRLPSLRVLDVPHSNYSGSMDFACDADGLDPTIRTPKLQRITLHNNSLTGPPLPACWSALTDLEIIQVGHNPLDEGFVPTSYAQLTSLRTLDVSGVKLRSPLVANLAPLKNLPELSLLALSDCELTGALPEDVFVGVVTQESWTSLTELDLSRNNINGPVTILLGFIPTLRVIDLSRNDLYGVVPYNIATYAKFVFFDHNPGMRGDRRVEFAVLAPTSIRYPGNLVCPELTDITGTLTLRVDPSYNDYADCMCDTAFRSAGGTCQPCPQNGVCDGTAHVAARPGYYPVLLNQGPLAANATALDIAFEPCQEPSGRATACNPNGAREFECGEGYEGRLCSKCANGFGHNGLQCVPCTSSGVDVLVMLAVVTVLAVLVGRAFTWPTNGSGITKSWLFYTQVSGLVSSVQPPPGSMSSLGDAFSLSNFGWSGIECLGLDSYATRIGVMWALPFLTVVCFGTAGVLSALKGVLRNSKPRGTKPDPVSVEMTNMDAKANPSADLQFPKPSTAVQATVNPIFAGRPMHATASRPAPSKTGDTQHEGGAGARDPSRVHLKHVMKRMITGGRADSPRQLGEVRYRSKDLKLSTTFAQSCIRTGLYTISLTYLPVASVMLHSLSCHEDAAGVAWMDAAPYIACSGEPRATIMGLAVTGTLLYAVGIPALFAVILWKGREQLYTRRWQIIFGFHFGLYRPSMWWYGVAHLCRNLILSVFLFSFGYGSHVSTLLVWLVLQASLLQGVVSQPYRSRLENLLHSASTAVVVVSLTATVITRDADAATRGFVGSLLLLMNAATMTAFAVAWAQRFRSVRQVTGRCKRALLQLCRRGGDEAS